MTIEQANAYFASLPEGFAPARQLQEALSAKAGRVDYLGVAGTAGKTTAAALTAAVLRAAGLVTGSYHAGCEPLSARIRVNGEPVAPELLAQAAETLSARETLPRAAAELAAAARCFGEAGCALAVVELPDAGLAEALPKMPVCAVTSIGPDGISASLERSAALAAGVMRKGSICVTAPEQPKAVVSELIVAAGKADWSCRTPMTSPSSKPKSSPAVWTTAAIPCRWPSWAVMRRAVPPLRWSWPWPSAKRAMTSPMKPFWKVWPLWRTAAASGSSPSARWWCWMPAAPRSKPLPCFAS